ncbi:hypothetical protein SELMODRAFT_404964 [Selaginella moellendorffii]|uniref:DCD domain-containing protein n=1 Tax=Selaginella moellendorffii TaxID=88036 RepID=D8QXY1_SELML|nr:hypothetical protein SELMODRAFT_404964 [Selaginella moellendorffii]
MQERSCLRAIALSSFRKLEEINVFLGITSKRPDGYHDLVSLFDFLKKLFTQATGFGDPIHPKSFEASKCRGESRFPAQVRTRVQKAVFQPILHHYDGPCSSGCQRTWLLDLFEEARTGYGEDEPI